MLNSSYGKTCEGLHFIKHNILNERDYKKFIFRNYNVVADIE
jgi:hypothetical protein